jgi:hypothetical protein
MKTFFTSLILGAFTGLIFRDEVYFPTYLRIKVALTEHRKLTRQELDSDLLDIVDS